MKLRPRPSSRLGRADVTRYIVRRILISIPILIGISAVVFILINLAPGDPIDALVDPLEMEVLSNEEVDRLREELGLNLPGPVRYFIWLRDVADRESWEVIP